MPIKPGNQTRVVRHTFCGWFIPLLLTLGMMVVFGSFAKGSSAAPFAQVVLPTATPAPGMQQDPGSGPVNGQTTSELDALLLRIVQTMQNLQNMVGQMGGQDLLLPTPNPTGPTATPTVPSYPPAALPRANLPWVRSELQELEKLLVPLMKRIQANTQGNPSPQEIASVRAEVNLFQIRFAYLADHLQKARGGSALLTVAPTPTVSPMPDLPMISPTATVQADLQQAQAMVNELDQLMQQMQYLLQQLQEQQTGANSNGTSADPMNGLNMSTPTVTTTVLPSITPTSLPGMQNTPPVQLTPMPGMASDNGGSNVSMDSLIATMESFTAMMDSMTGNPSVQMGGMNMPASSPTPAPTAVPDLSNSNSSMNDIMTMIDKLMQMMDDLAKMMNDRGGAGGTN